MEIVRLFLSIVNSILGKIALKYWYLIDWISG
jgi:hypothetical protein